MIDNVIKYYIEVVPCGERDMMGLTHAAEGAQFGVLLQQGQEPRLSVMVALGGALIFYGMSLVTWGGFGMGAVGGRSAGIVSALAGALGLVWAVLILVFLPTSGAATAAVVGAFAFAFLSAGLHTPFDVDLAGHGLLCLVLAGVVAVVAYTFTVPLAGSGYLAFAMWSYVVVLVAFFGGAYYGTDRWLQVFTISSFFTGIVTTSLYGALLITGLVGF